jgi:4-amino-4-deoxy-L-arabinose transferase-like glycosyltransferase
LEQLAPIRSRAPAEGNFQIPLWSVIPAVLVIGVCLFGGLNAMGLVGPDEPRYAAIARAMAETHDWVTPRLWGTPWFEKPILYYWMAGIAFRLFGVSEFSARLPSGLAGLLAVAAAAWTALRCYGMRAACYTLLMLPATVAMIAFARAAGPDMLFTAFLAAALAAAIEILQKPRAGTPARILFGVFLGTAVLAKGPAAVLLAGGGVLLWSAVRGRWSASLRFLHPVVIVASCAAALPWYVLCALRNPDFLRIFLWQHNFKRYLTPVFEHHQPFWFFGYILLLAVIPWTGIFVSLFGRLKDRDGWKDSPGLLLACWSGFTVLFFSFSESKLPGYILPAIPPLFVLLGRQMARFREHAKRAAFWPLAATGVIFLAFAPPLAWSLLNTKRLAEFASTPALGGALVSTVAAGILILLFTRQGQVEAAVLASSLLVTLLVEISVVGILPRADRFLSARALANSLASQSASPSAIAEYKLPRVWDYGLHYYLGSRLEKWGAGAVRPNWIVTTSEGAAEIENSGSVRIQAVQPVQGAPITLLRVSEK